MAVKLLVLFAVCVAAVAAQSYSAPSYSPPSYSAPSYSAPSYKPADGRVKIQVYRGPNKDQKGYGQAGYGYGESFAPHGYYVQQPEDQKAYGYH